MENNNQDPRLDELLPDEIADQDITYAEEATEAVDGDDMDITEPQGDEQTEAEMPEDAVAETEEATEAETEAIDADEPDEESNCECAEKKKNAFLSAIYDYAEIFAVSIIAVIFIFSFCIRLCRVDGHSMQTTLTDNERIIAYDLFYTPKQGDIVVFHLVNDAFQRPLVKRVIATAGQTVEINYTDKEIRVDGVLYDDSHAHIEGGEYIIKIDFDTKYMIHEDGKLYYRATVPEGKIFVLGDNRNNSTDSRSVNVGFVDEDCVLGKAILRLDPFTIFD